MNAIDTNVFVYALDDDAPAKQTKAQELIDRLVQPPIETILPCQVAGELLSCLRKWQSAGQISGFDVETHFRDVPYMFPLRIPTVREFDISFDLQARFRLSPWDSMLLAARKDAGVTTLYSEDFDHGTNYDGVSVVNPFA